MNTYYSQLGRLIEGRTPLANEGYYVLYEDDTGGYQLEKPKRTKIVTVEDFITILVEGCKAAIRSFARKPDNKDVYAFNLYADEQNSIYIYLNTLGSFNETLEKYGYVDLERINGLKYGQGDFGYQFWSDDMGKSGKLIDSFESLANLAMDLDPEELGEDITEMKKIIAFEAGIIVNSGYQVLALRALQRLIAENAFMDLNKTDDFIAYAATGNDYLDFSVIMRKTIASELFYNIFPDILEKDRKFEEEMEKNRTLSASEQLDYWSEAVQSQYGSATPYSYDKSEYEVFVRLENLGNSLAGECLKRLGQLMRLNSLEREQYNYIYYYVEALHFSGELTEEQKRECLTISEQLYEKEFKEASVELKQLGTR